MNKDIFLNYMRFPELLDDRSMQGLKEILAEYPFFQTARLLYIKNLHNQGSLDFDKNLRLTAVFIPDRSRLFYLLDQRALFPAASQSASTGTFDFSNEEVIDFGELSDATPIDMAEPVLQKEKPKSGSIEDIILSGMMGSTPFFKVDDKVDIDDFKKAFKKKPDTEITPDEEIRPTDRKSSLIEQFIQQQPRIVPKETSQQEQPDISISSTSENQELITDTLAKIYIKQGLYEKALMAYEKLSLKYPEKNTYFAAQIKKIKQFINNQ